jgi:hypothetical protein
MTLTHIPDLIPYLNSSVEDDRMEVKKFAPSPLPGEMKKNMEKEKKPL